MTVDRTALRASSVGEWREIAEWDWVRLNDEPTSPATIHAIELLDNAATADDDWYGVGTTACGKTGEMYIPGIVTRMTARRCPACCDAVGMPHGEQSPKNIDECRPIVEARLRALKGADDASDRYDVFNRTDDERQRAFEHIVARATAGRNGDLLELSVCADCGQYGVWDSDLHHPLDERPTGSVCCHPSGRHLVTRVALRPIPPGER